LTDRPWLELDELAALFGYTLGSAKNKICDGSFPVPTYKLGRRTVADRTVVETYFALKREEGLRALKSTRR
jgi:uncharacterized protein YfaA (DUF2138 family)